MGSFILSLSAKGPRALFNSAKLWRKHFMLVWRPSNPPWGIAMCHKYRWEMQETLMRYTAMT
eukprot:1153467-Pelagomonas_calceolata.AAC.7